MIQIPPRRLLIPAVVLLIVSLSLISLHGSPSSELVFRSGYEPASTANNSTALTTINGTDNSTGFSWQNDLKGHPQIGNWTVEYLGGTNTQRWARIIQEPGNTGNHVLWMNINEPNSSNGNGRVQASMYGNTGIHDFTLRNRLRLHPDMQALTQWSSGFTFLTIYEFWNRPNWIGSPYPYRLKVDVTKASGSGQPLRFRAQAQIDASGSAGTSNWQTLWTQTATASIPIGAWFNLEVRVKEGNAENGHFFMSMQTVNGQNTTLFNLTGATMHPNNPSPVGFTHINSQKLYTSAGVINHLKNQGKSLQVYWDDFEFWINNEEGAPLITGLSVASVTAEQAGNEAVNLFDGDYSGNVGSRWSAQGYPQSVVLDLGAAYTLQHVDVYPSSQRAYQYTIAVADNATGPFTVVVNRSANTTSTTVLSDPIADVCARFVRLQVTGASGYSGDWVSIVELDLFGTPASCAPLITGLSVASVTAEEPGNEAVNLFDGDYSGNVGSRWAAEGYPQSVVLDLGATYTLEQVDVFPFSERAYQYTIAVANNATGPFTVVVNRSANTTGTTVLSDPIADVCARFVRLQVIGASGYSGNWVNIVELDLFGTPASCAPQPLEVSNIQPTEDSFVRAGTNANQTNGTSPTLWVKNDGATANNTREMFIKFPVDSRFVSVSAAEVKLFIDARGTSTNWSFVVERVAPTWGEATITWNNSRSFTGTHAFGYVPAASGSDVLNVTAAVAAAVAEGASEVAFRVRSLTNQGTNDWIRYFSRDSTNSAVRPVITISGEQ